MLPGKGHIHKAKSASPRHQISRNGMSHNTRKLPSVSAQSDQDPLCIFGMTKDYGLFRRPAKVSSEDPDQIV